MYVLFFLSLPSSQLHSFLSTTSLFPLLNYTLSSSQLHSFLSSTSLFPLLLNFILSLLNFIISSSQLHSFLSSTSLFPLLNFTIPSSQRTLFSNVFPTLFLQYYCDHSPRLRKPTRSLFKVLYSAFMSIRILYLQ